MRPIGVSRDHEYEALVDEYGEWMRSWSASERTIGARQVLIRSRLREWGLEGFTPANIQTFLASPELESKWSRSTYYSHLKSFCEWLVVTGRFTENPLEQVRQTKRPESKPRPLTEAQVTQVLAVATGRTLDWIKLALLAGLRASEIAAIHGEDVDPDGIYVVGKGGKKVTLPCHPEIWEMAQRYPRRGPWFPNKKTGEPIAGQQVSMTVSRLFKRLGIAGSIHRCRHTYGTRLLRQGEHIRVVQKLMRHANLETTAAYTAVDEDELRAAINRLGTAS